MTRKKVTLAYINNDSERKASFKKRKKGLIKKVSELSTLCGVDACAIIYSQYDAEPEVWPSQLGAQAIIARFRKLSDMDQSRKMVNQETFTQQRIKKAADQVRRLRKENRFRELQGFMFACIKGHINLRECTNLPDPAEMNWVVKQTLRDITARMEYLEAEERRRLQEPQPQPQPHVAPSLPLLLPPPLPPQPEPQPLPEETPETQPPPTTMEDENNIIMESFPWNLVQSPVIPDMESGGLGWDNGMNPPYPYSFNPSNPDNYNMFP